MGFSYDLKVDGNIQLIAPKGRILDRSEAEEMITEVSQNIQDGKSRLIFDFEGIDYMNSAGLNVLITLLTKSRNEYGEMALYNLSEKVKKLLVTSKLQNIFKIVETEAAARELVQ